MAYLAGKIAFVLLRPSNLLLLLGLAGLVGALARRRWGRPSMAASLLALAAAAALPFGHWLLLPLEDRFPAPATYPDRVAGVVVLGGGVDTRISAVRGQASFKETMERFAAIPELARRYPDAPIVFTGGMAWNAGARDVPEAQVIAQFLERQGLPAARVILEPRARSTRDNATLVRELVRPEPNQRWLLVTSAAHMPRAVGVFRRAGWPEPLPWPVDYRTTGAPAEIEWPSLGPRLQQLDEAAYEWYALVYYRLLGYTDALLPGPRDG